MIKIQRRYECGSEGCDSVHEAWCHVHQSFLEGHPEGWSVWMDETGLMVRCDAEECAGGVQGLRDAEAARLEEQRTAALEAGKVALERRARRARQARIREGRPRPGDERAEAAAVAAEEEE